MQSDTFGGKAIMASLACCARCGSDDLEDKEVEKLIRGGDDVAALRGPATVCHHCGERYPPVEAIRALEQARRDLAEGKLARFRTVGRVVVPQLDPSG
ncbi:MAG TPA: YgiT-type zinc finger protein [Kofleriaceae bacterium]